MKKNLLMITGLLACSSFNISTMEKPKPNPQNEMHQALEFINEKNLFDKIQELQITLLNALISQKIDSVSKTIESCPKEARYYFINEPIETYGLTHRGDVTLKYPAIKTFLDELDQKKVYGFYNQTPLALAVYLGDQKIVELLHAHKAQVNRSFARHGYCSTALHVATKYQPKLIKFLIDCGAHKDGGLSCEAPIFIAAQEGNVEAAQALIAAGASLKVKTQGMDLTLSPLMVACNRGRYELVKYLLEEAQVEVDETDPDGRTALHWSTMNMQNHIASLLLTHNADVTRVTRQGNSVIECIPVNFGSLEAKLLFECGAPYPQSAQHQELLKKGIDMGLHFGSPFYKRYLRALSQNNTNEVLAAIQEAHGDELNSTTYNAKKLTALHWAAIRGNKPVSDALIATMRNQSSMNIFGQTLPLVSRLVQNPANLDCQDEKGCTPLIWAAHLGHKEIYCALARAGANREIKDRNNKTALDHARDCKKDSILALTREDLTVENPLHPAEQWKTKPENRVSFR